MAIYMRQYVSKAGYLVNYTSYSYNFCLADKRFMDRSRDGGGGGGGAGGQDPFLENETLL